MALAPFNNYRSAFAEDVSRGVVATIGENKAEWPLICEMIKCNPDGTVRFLAAEGAIIGAKASHSRFQRSQTGDNNLRTWADYRGALVMYLEEQYLEKMKTRTVPPYMRELLKKVAKHIWDKHYSEFKYWPSLKKGQQSTYVYLDHSTKFDYPNLRNKQIFFSIEGTLIVKDKHELDSDDEHCYYTECSGNLTLDFVILDRNKIEALEWKYKSNKAGLKAAINECGKLTKSVMDISEKLKMLQM